MDLLKKFTMGGMIKDKVISPQKDAYGNTIEDILSPSSLISWVFFAAAIYLALQCRKKGVNIGIGEMLAIICCSPCYVAYRGLMKPC
jgi:hypothetical protein